MDMFAMKVSLERDWVKAEIHTAVLHSEGF